MVAEACEVQGTGIQDYCVDNNSFLRDKRLSTPAGPLSQDMLSLGGFFFSGRTDEV
jgi:hypothetical protein